MTISPAGATRFTARCHDCPLRDRCTTAKDGESLMMHRHHDAHATARAAASDPYWQDLWQQLRRLPDPDIARKFKGARWALLKNPEDLTARQAVTLAAIKRHGGTLWRAYQRKEELRAIFVGGLTDTETAELLDRWCARVSAPGCSRSSRPGAPSANTARASSPRSALG